MLIYVTAGKETTGSLGDEATVSGGGGRSVTVHDTVSVGPVSPVFGVEDVEMQAYNENGSLDTQAGSHPFELTTTFNLNENYSPSEGTTEPIPHPAGLAKDLHFQLPAGLVGNPQVIPQCTETEFTTPIGFSTACPLIR